MQHFAHEIPMQYIPRAAGRQRKTRAIWQLDSAANGASINFEGESCILRQTRPTAAERSHSTSSANFVRQGWVTASLSGIEYPFSCSEETSRLLDCRAHYLHIPAHTSAQVRRVASKLISDISGTKQVPSVTCSIPPSCYGSRTKVLLTGRDWQGILDCGATFTSVLPRAVRSSVRSFDFRMLLLKAS